MLKWLFLQAEKKILVILPSINYTLPCSIIRCRVVHTYRCDSIYYRAVGVNLVTGLGVTETAL